MGLEREKHGSAHFSLPLSYRFPTWDRKSREGPKRWQEHLPHLAVAVQDLGGLGHFPDSLPSRNMVQGLASPLREVRVRDGVRGGRCLCRPPPARVQSGEGEERDREFCILLLSLDLTFRQLGIGI